MKVYFNARIIPGLKNKKQLPVRKSKLDMISALVASEFGVKYDDVFKKCRKRELVMTRQISMLLTKKNEPGLTLKRIGNYFGGRDHTTAIHGMRTINNLMQTDLELRARVNKLQQMIEINFV